MSYVADAAAGGGAWEATAFAEWLIGTGSFPSLAQFFLRERNLGQTRSPHRENLYWAWIYAIDGEDCLIPILRYHEIAGRHWFRTRRIRIACPVDIWIYDSENILVGRVINNINDESLENASVDIVIVGDVKYIYTTSFDIYTIRIMATDYGTMTYTIDDIDFLTLQTVEHREFPNVPLAPGKEMASLISYTPHTRLLITEGDMATGEITIAGEVIVFDAPQSLSVLFTVDGSSRMCLWFVVFFTGGMIIIIGSVLWVVYRYRGKSPKAIPSTADITEQPVFCVKCGNSIASRKTKFCGRCGSTIKHRK